MSGRNGSYIGAPEVSSLIGAWQDIVGGQWQDIVGSTVYQPFVQQRAPRYTPPAPWYQGRNVPRRHHHHHHPHPHAPTRPYAAPYAAPYTPPYAPPRQYAPPFPQIPASVRDHRRVAFIRGAVSGDPVSLGALSLMGAEDAAAAQQGTVPPDALMPAPPLAPGDAAAAAAAAATPPAPPLPGPTAAAAVTAVQATDPARDARLAEQDAILNASADAAIAQANGGGDPRLNPNTSQPAHRGHRHGHGGGYQGGYGAQFNGIPPRNMLVDRPSPTRADRVILPMSSGVNILPSTSAQITARPQNVAFRPERIVIGGSPGDWIVNDIKVGNQSQLSQSGDLPGEMFSSTMVDGFISFGTVQTAMDFVIQVTFIGDSEGGAPFFCGVLGTAAV